MAHDTTTLTRTQVDEEHLADWELMVGAIEARYETGGFATGLELVNRIGAAAEEADHHPDLTLTWPYVHARLVSHDAGGVTSRDIALARRISEIAADLGVTSTREKLTRVEFGLDTADKPAAVRFWAAVLGYDVDDDIAVVGPRRASGGAVVPGDRYPRRTSAALPRRRHRPSRPGAVPDRRRAGGGRHPREHRPRAGLHGARRPRGQQGLRVHLAGPGVSPGVSPE